MPSVGLLRKNKSALQRVFRPLLHALWACALGASTSVAMADNVRLGGTGSALGTMRLLADAYAKIDPQFNLVIVPNLGSSGGIKALSQDKIHLAVTGRGLKPDEVKAGLTAYTYGKTPFVLATSNKNPESLTLDQIANIYANKQTKWADGSQVRLVLRPAHDGDTELLAGISPGIKAGVELAMAKEGMVVANTDQESADVLEKLAGSFGFTSLSIILTEKRALSVVPINGVVPSVDSLKSGSYPYGKNMAFVVKGVPSESIARFLAFVRSEAGTRVLVASGHWVSTATAALPNSKN